MAAKILIVEDHVLNRNVICKVLRNEGYTVMEASDRAHAVDLLHAQVFDLVIMDFVMPKLTELSSSSGFIRSGASSDNFH
jgi:CheY-like chemotaxis protein